MAICVPSPQSINRLLPLYLTISDVSQRYGKGIMPPVPNKHTSSIFYLDLISTLYFYPKTSYELIIAVLTEIELVYLIIFSGEISPALLHFKHVLLGNPLAYQNLFPAFIANDFFDLLSFL